MTEKTLEKVSDKTQKSTGKRRMVTIDGNTAAAHVAHATNEVIAIYPITPSSDMGEKSDVKSARGEKNIWGTVPTVVEMQSEGGASGAVHGALTTGCLTTTFTASQGLLLMIPNMYKIAGEMTPTVFHVSARALASHALSIFGDHSDVMATRSTGFGLMASGSVQNVMDLALDHPGGRAAQPGAVRAFLRRFPHVARSRQGRRDHVRRYARSCCRLSWSKVSACAPSPRTGPTIKGTSQNPDVFFQHRETVNKYYLGRSGYRAGRDGQVRQDCRTAVPSVRLLRPSAGRARGGHHGHRRRDGSRSGRLARGQGRKSRLDQGPPVSSVLEPRPLPGLFRRRVKRIAVLDRTKEAGSVGEPMYTDVQTAVNEALDNGWVKFTDRPLIVGGRYGLGSSEFNPPMVKGIFDDLKTKTPKNHFTVGIVDDVTHTSLPMDLSVDLEGEDFRGLFYGLGSDGTVGANKNSIKIIGEYTDNYAQGYFVYDSKKAGAVTVSHVRFGKNEIRKPYLIKQAQFVACHNESFLEKYEMVEKLCPGGTFLLNCTSGAGQGLGHAAEGSSGADDRQEGQVLRDRRHRAGQAARPRRPHQHDHADRLLLHLGHSPEGKSDRSDQAHDRRDLRRQGRESRQDELRRGRRRGGQSARSEDSGESDRDQRAAADRSGFRSRVRQECHGRDHRRPRRPAAGVGVPG